MSEFTGEFEVFFKSPAGISLLTWLKEQRTTEYQKAEMNPRDAGYYVSTAKAYSEVWQYIDSMMTEVVKSPYSSGVGNQNPGRDKIAPSTGLGTSL